jgi:pimeloyl-ACP methyl ester carboxylesterase
MFRDLIPLLANRLPIVARDLPGFDQSDMPPRDEFSYTFDNIARVIGRFTEVTGFERIAACVFDYAVRHRPLRPRNTCPMRSPKVFAIS